MLHNILFEFESHSDDPTGRAVKSSLAESNISPIGRIDSPAKLYPLLSPLLEIFKTLYLCSILIVRVAWMLRVQDESPHKYGT